MNLLDALWRNQIDAKILLVSTSQVYGKSAPGLLLSEDSPLEPDNPYASSKRLSEEIALQYRKQFSSRVVITRPFNHTGPGQSEDFVISDFCRQIAMLELEAARSGKSGRKMCVGNLKSTLDFLDARDVVRAYAGLAEKGVEGEIYNICSGVGTEISEILDTAISLAEVDIELAAIIHKFGVSVDFLRKFRAESVFRCDYKASKLVEPNRDEARAPSGNSSGRRGLYICVGAGSQGTVRWDTDGASVMRRAFVRDKTMPGAPRCDEKFPEPGHRF